MDDLRERFAALDDVEVPDLADLDRRALPHAASRPEALPRRAPTIAVAVAVAVASIAILLRALEPAPEETPIGAKTLTPRVGPQIAVGGSPNAIAVGAGGVWVSALPDGDGPRRLVRLDPATGDVVAKVMVPALPTWEVGGGGLLAADGEVWLTGGADIPERDVCCHAVVSRIDPAANEVVEGIDLGAGFGADLWLDGTGLWVLLFDETSDPGVSVARLDPVSLDEVARIRLPSDWAKQVFAFDGSIWVHGNREGVAEAGGVVPDALFRIDPASNRYVERIDLPSEEFPLAVDGSAVWQRTSRAVVRIAPADPAIRVPLDGMEEHCCSHILSDGRGGLWVLARGDGPDRLRVTHVSAAGAIDARSEVDVPGAALGSVAVAFDPVRQTIWLAQYRDTVTPLRLDLG